MLCEKTPEPSTVSSSKADESSGPSVDDAGTFGSFNNVMWC